MPVGFATRKEVILEKDSGYHFSGMSVTTSTGSSHAERLKGR